MSDFKNPKNTLKIKSVVLGFAVVVIASFFYPQFFGAPQKNAELGNFSVRQNAEIPKIISDLKEKKFIKNTAAFDFALSWKRIKDIKPGGYIISKSMNTWKIIEVLSGKPALVWVTIPEGLRKEEVANILALKLGWPEEEKTNWLRKYTVENPDYIEGVYFPDTYLIPANEKPEDTAKRLQAKFQEKFAPLAPLAIEQNIKWTTLLRLASIIQREAAGESDMPLIAGILWNRLLAGQKLQVDATVQYARGKTEDGWWAPIKSEDKKLDSLYNTYKYLGLPPRAICSPGIEAMKAVIAPEETKCIFYLHDDKGQIHCAETYEEHLQNIEKYLK